MNTWKIGESETLFKNKKFNLLAKRVESKVVNKHFNSQIYKFKIDLIVNQYTNNQLELNDGNIDLLKNGIEDIFDKLKSSYKKRDGPFYIQMNLTFDGLKKEFLKSGIVDLFGHVNSKNIVYWVINQLDQVNQSSDNLIFSNNLFIDFILVKTVKPKGKSINSLQGGIVSNYALRIYKIVDKFNANYFFNIDLKKGFVDMSIFFKNSVIYESYNCVLISIYFALLFDKFKKDMKQTLMFISSKFKSLLHFENFFKKEYKLDHFNFHNHNKNSSNYDYIANKIKRNILIFVKKCNNTCKLVYSTKNKDFDFIKLVIDNDHCKFVFNNINLEKEKTTFCDYCNKSFAKIKSHKCKRNKCEHCFKFTKMLTNGNNEIICQNKVIKNDNYTCDHCNKTMYNSACIKRHLLLSRVDCKSKMFCDKCNTLYLQKCDHTCGRYFCKKCLSNHENRYFCSTSISIPKRKIKESIFCMDIQYNGTVIYCMCISQFNEKTQLQTLYYFYTNSTFYKKVIINIETLNVIKSEKIECNIKLDIVEIIQCLDIINLKPKFIIDQKHLEYLINHINLSNCTFLSKDSLIYYVKSKYFSFISINQYITYDPIYILKHSNTNICPLYIINLDTSKLTSMQQLSMLSISDFTTRYMHSDYNMFEYINSFQCEINVINNLYLFEFLEKSSMYKIVIYQQAINTLNSVIKEVNTKMNDHFNNARFVFNSVTDKQSSSSSMFDIFLNTIENQPLPTLHSSTPGQIYNTSKYEICFCETITTLHLQNYPSHKIQSYINNDGTQFTKNKFSLDW